MLISRLTESLDLKVFVTKLHSGMVKIEWKKSSLENDRSFRIPWCYHELTKIFHLPRTEISRGRLRDNNLLLIPKIIFS